MIQIPDLDKERARLLEQVDKQMAEVALKKRILENLPEPLQTLEVEIAHGFGFENDGGVLFNVDTEKQVFEVLDKLDTLEIVRHRDSCTSFIPLVSAERNRKSYAEENCIEAGTVIYDLEFIGDRFYKNRLHAYINIQELVVKISFDIRKPLTKLEVSFERTKKGNVVEKDGKPVVEGWHITNNAYFRERTIWNNYGVKTSAEVTLFGEKM